MAALAHCGCPLWMLCMNSSSEVLFLHGLPRTQAWPFHLQVHEHHQSHQNMCGQAPMPSHPDGKPSSRPSAEAHNNEVLEDHAEIVLMRRANRGKTSRASGRNKGFKAGQAVKALARRQSVGSFPADWKVASSLQEGEPQSQIHDPGKLWPPLSCALERPVLPNNAHIGQGKPCLPGSPDLSDSTCGADKGLCTVSILAFPPGAAWKDTIFEANNDARFFEPSRVRIEREARACTHPKVMLQISEGGHGTANPKPASPHSDPSGIKEPQPEPFRDVANTCGSHIGPSPKKSWTPKAKDQEGEFRPGKVEESRRDIFEGRRLLVHAPDRRRLIDTEASHRPSAVCSREEEEDAQSLAGPAWQGLDKTSDSRREAGEHGILARCYNTSPHPPSVKESGHIVLTAGSVDAMCVQQTPARLCPGWKGPAEGEETELGGLRTSPKHEQEPSGCCPAIGRRDHHTTCVTCTYRCTDEGQGEEKAPILEEVVGGGEQASGAGLPPLPPCEGAACRAGPKRDAPHVHRVRAALRRCWRRWRLWLDGEKEAKRLAAQHQHRLVLIEERLHQTAALSNLKNAPVGPKRHSRGTRQGKSHATGPLQKPEAQADPSLQHKDPTNAYGCSHADGSFKERTPQKVPQESASVRAVPVGWVGRTATKLRPVPMREAAHEFLQEPVGEEGKHGLHDVADSPAVQSRLGDDQPAGPRSQPAHSQNVLRGPQRAFRDSAAVLTDEGTERECVGTERECSASGSTSLPLGVRAGTHAYSTGNVALAEAAQPTCRGGSGALPSAPHYGARPASVMAPETGDSHEQQAREIAARMARLQKKRGNLENEMLAEIWSDLQEAQARLAQMHYVRSLLKWWGWVPWSHGINHSRARLAAMRAQIDARCATRAVHAWRRHAASLNIEREDRASAFARARSFKQLLGVLQKNVDLLAVQDRTARAFFSRVITRKVLRSWSGMAHRRGASHLLACRKLAACANRELTARAFHCWSVLPYLQKEERKQEVAEKAALAQLKKWLVEYRCNAPEPHDETTHDLSPLGCPSEAQT
eukprot:jgi/Botrbrau1/4388/Bobra.105_2s0034.1